MNTNTLDSHFVGRSTRVLEGAGSVIISVPHSAINLPIPHLQKRTEGIVSRDLGSWLLVKEMLARHAFPTVRNLVPRIYLDPNKNPKEKVFEAPLRDTSLAFVDPRLSSSFSLYHEHIAVLLGRAKQCHERKTLLLDMHTFYWQPPYAPEEGYDIILGTGNRTTILYDEIDKRVAFFLREKGFRVFLPTENLVYGKGEWYSGGFTVFYHSFDSRVNALQMEVREAVSQNPVRRSELSACLVEFFEGNK